MLHSSRYRLYWSKLRLGTAQFHDNRGIVVFATGGARAMTNRARLIETTLSTIAALAIAEGAAAQDARWKASPPTNDWNNPADWDPATVPTGTAIFGASGRTEIVITQRNNAVARMLFEPGAPAYTFVIDGRRQMTLIGTGIDNRSAHPATFLIGTHLTDELLPGPPFIPSVRFQGSASAGNSIFTIGTEPFTVGHTTIHNLAAELVFHDTSSADSSTITNYFSLNFDGSSTAATSHIVNHATAHMRNDATADRATIENIFGGLILGDRATAAQSSIHNLNGAVWFDNLSTAGSSLIVNDPGPANPLHIGGVGINSPVGLLFTGSDQQHSFTAFLGNSRAGTATIINNAGAGPYRPTAATSGANIVNSSVTLFYDDGSAENAAITNNGGGAGSFIRMTGPEADRLVEANNAALTFFSERATAANATIVNNNAAWTVFFNQSSAGAATITTNDGSTVLFRDRSGGGTARFINNGGGTIDISGVTTAGVQTGSIEGAGAVMLGGKRLTLGGNDRSTEISGIISDGGFSGGAGGSLVKIGTGTLTLTGANSYTGGTTIDSGTLRLGNGGATGSIAGNVVDNGTLVFNRSDPVTYAGVVSGTGTLVKTGTGMLTLAGASTYTGATTVADGILRVNGSIASAVTVNPDARLDGTGTIGGLTVAGTLAPGNSIGTITVAGNATFASGSTYEVEVDGAGNSDKTLVTGTATLQGGTVAALFQGQAEQCGAPFQYTILTAQGGVSGAFAGVTSNFAFLAPSLSYDPNNVILTLTRAPGTFADHGATPNQRQTAAAAEALG
ncbi:MAG: autotransporter-associated beta strand repeat-containing protein, partial [Allosphingosinicella sp.]